MRGTALFAILAMPMFFSTCMQVFRPQHPMRMLLRVDPTIQIARTGQPACIVITFGDKTPKGAVEIYRESAMADLVMIGRSEWRGGQGVTTPFCRPLSDNYYLQRSLIHKEDYMSDRFSEPFGGMDVLKQPIDNQSTWDGTVKGEVQYRTLDRIVAREPYTIQLSCPRCTV
jgi:hypothetical protein